MGKSSSESSDTQQTSKSSHEESPETVAETTPVSDEATETKSKEEKEEEIEEKIEEEEETEEKETSEKGTPENESNNESEPQTPEQAPSSSPEPSPAKKDDVKSEKDIQKQKKEEADKLKKSYSDLSHEIKDHVNPIEIITRLDKELSEISDETENLDIIINGFSLCTSSILSNTNVDEHEDCVRAKNKFFKKVFLTLLTVPNNLESVHKAIKTSITYIRPL